MKNSIYVIGTLLLLGMTSCYEDLGNYSYSDKQAIRIDSIKEEYVGFTGDTLKITPVIISEKDILRYEWSVYSLEESAGKVIVLDSVKDLRYPVVLSQATYQLLFTVTDIDGYSETVTSQLTVSTTYSEGFYVLKEVNGETDLDLYPTGKGAVQDLFFHLHDKRLQGKPVGLFIAPQHKYIDTVPQKKFVFFPISEQESPMIQLQNIEPVFNDFEDLFYESPVNNEKPLRYVHGADIVQALITDKHVYSYACMAPTVSGKFGDYAYFETEIQPCPYVALDQSFSPKLILLYDNLNGQFLNLNQFNMLSRFKNTPPEGQKRPVNPYGLNCQMVYMKQPKAGGNAYALLKHKESDKRYLFTLLMDWKQGSEINPVVKVDTLSKDLHINQAENFTVSENSIYLYYSVGRQLYQYDIEGHKETSLPLDVEGDEITMIDYLYWLKTPVNQQWHYFFVATHTNGRYKLYRYNIRGDQPDLSQKPVINEGEGKAEALHYTSPYMNSNLSWYPYN